MRLTLDYPEKVEDCDDNDEKNEEDQHQDSSYRAGVLEEVFGGTGVVAGEVVEAERVDEDDSQGRLVLPDLSYIELGEETVDQEEGLVHHVANLLNKNLANISFIAWEFNPQVQ